MDIDMQKIQNRIKDIRMKSGLSQEAFYKMIMGDKATAGSTSQARQSKLEKDACPTLEELAAIASYTCDTLDNLVYGEHYNDKKTITYRDLCRAIYMLDIKYDMTFDAIQTIIEHKHKDSFSGNTRVYEKTHQFPSVVFNHIPSELDDDCNPFSTYIDDMNTFIDNYKRLKEAHLPVSVSVYNGNVQSLLDKVSDEPIPEVDMSDDSKKK